MIDLDNLWKFPWFDRRLRAHYGIDARRHIRYDRDTCTVYYVIRRSAPRSGNPGRFAVDERTLHWLLGLERHGRVEDALVVFVEDWVQTPPKIVRSGPAQWLWGRVEYIVPLTSQDETSTFWWLDDAAEPVDVWLGPVLKVAPF